MIYITGLQGSNSIHDRKIISKTSRNENRSGVKARQSIEQSMGIAN